LFNQTIWGNKGLGQPVLGRRETVKSFTREDLISHIRKYYGTKDVVISCAGNFEHGSILSVLNKSLGSLRRGSEPVKGPLPYFESKVDVFHKELSEAHMCFGIEGLPQTSDHRYSLYVLNTIFGAGVSSRLFQEIREKRGLAYSIYSFISSYYDTGIWGVYAGVSRKRVGEVAGLILKEMNDLKSTLTEVELQRAKNHLKGNIILGLESTSSRMTNIARQEIYHGRYYSPKEIMREVDSISLADIQALAEKLIKQEGVSLTVFGPVYERDLKGLSVSPVS
jgi:predicted Zn-dependent peptidase